MTKFGRILVAFFAFVAIAGAYLISKNAPANKKSDALTIGYIGPLTGDASSLGVPMKNAVSLATEELNAQGVNVRVIYEDGKCNGKDAATAAQKLVNIDNVKFIIGGLCSGETLAAAPIVEAAKVILLSPASTAPSISEAGDFIFRNTPSDAKGGAVLAAAMISKHKKVAIISENTDYAQGYRKVFSEEFVKGGGTIVSDESYAPGTKDFRSLLTKVKQAAPEAIFVNPQNEITAIQILTQIKQMKISAAIYGSNVTAGSEVIKQATKEAEGMLFADAPGLDSSSARTKEFLDNFSKQYEGGVEAYNASAYDGVYLFHQALVQAGDDTEKVRDYFYGLTDYHGVFGIYGFDDKGDIEGISFVMKQVKGGKTETIPEIKPEPVSEHTAE